jgi:hypothetical protein
MPDEHSPSAPKLRRRYGIGEWFGRSFVEMSAVERAEVAQAISRGEADRLCPWRSRSGQPRACTKKGGVCSLRLYEQNTDTGEVWAPGGDKAGFCTTCPERFYEDDMVFAWIGEVMLASHSPIVLSEIGFLDRENTASEQGSTRSEVGKIDHVLVHPERDTLTWCALEMQAVYFSGASMSKEFSALRTAGDHPGLPFPAAHRRPDFRSSGPKRLMPQLQIKVPALRRWGKKAAVVVDRAFFDALGEMDDVPSLSNADIAWFIVAYREQEQGVALEPDFVRLTTLERAVEGLTAGRPVSLQTFEQRIREKLGS